jgi:periplasmic protein TonB
MRANTLVLLGLGAVTGCVATQPRQPLQQLSAPAPVEVPNGTPVRPDPAHPPIVHFQDYPPASVQAREQGSCMVKLTVGPDGLVQDTQVTIPTGIARLDQACLSAYRHQHFLPATRDGKPIVSTIELPVNWRLPNQ